MSYTPPDPFVKGPSSSTDNALARFDSTTGKLVQDSGVTLDDSDNLSGAASLTLAERASTPTTSAGLAAIWADNSAPNEPRFTDDVGFGYHLLRAPLLTASGDLYYANGTTDSLPSRLAIGSSGQILSVASGAPAWITGGKIAQIQSNVYTSGSTTTSQIPNDGSVPQITEGAQIMSVSITPTNASSTLIAFAYCWLAINSSTNAATAALFRDTESPNAAATSTCFNASTFSRTSHFLSDTWSAGSTSSTTFTVRMGRTGTAGTVTFNGSGGSAELGATVKSAIYVLEVLS